MDMDATVKELVESLSLELRRGTIILSVLSQMKQPKYGYSLVQVLEQKGMSIEAGTLYPLLRRLEKQGLLKSEWQTDSNKPRKYYSLTTLGSDVYGELCTQWNKLVDGMKHLMDGGAQDE
ncbi:PadR family transcriptional regulator [Christensenellaceae bacterium OttesenSCG-928-K19]|nr:PadR family transcriptional regulator [Christensenellaceae bacterium OttesenSCG-928-K19]